MTSPQLKSYAMVKRSTGLSHWDHLVFCILAQVFCLCLPALPLGLFLSVSSLSFPFVHDSVLLISLELNCVIKMLPFSWMSLNSCDCMFKLNSEEWVFRQYLGFLVVKLVKELAFDLDSWKRHPLSSPPDQLIFISDKKVSRGNTIMHPIQEWRLKIN